MIKKPTVFSTDQVMRSTVPVTERPCPYKSKLIDDILAAEQESEREKDEAKANDPNA